MKVRINLSALQRIAYSTVVEVPDETTDEELQRLAQVVHETTEIDDYRIDYENVTFEPPQLSKDIKEDEPPLERAVIEEVGFWMFEDLGTETSA